MKHIKTAKGGFALPTVLIASVVMLIIMATSVTSVVSVRTALKSQYYEQLARAAGEAGVAYAKACLAKNGNVPLWTDAKPLSPSTDCAGNHMLQPQVQVLVVAGGGGGGGYLGGGGGGGGVVANNAVAVAAQAYPVTVGSGGAAGASTFAGGAGGNSVFGSISATGGGGGGARIATNSVRPAGTGGSGGGGAGTIDSGTGFAAAGANGTAGQGNKGGNGSSGSTAGNAGGGGGAGAAGGNATGTASGAGVSGNGGNGYLSDITGASVYYGAGGSGARWGAGTVGIPGLSGAGTGGSNSSAGTAGAANTGAGGGGGASNAAGGAGGSGVVIVRYPTNGSVTATASNVTPTTEGSYRVFRFTSSGTFTVTSTAVSSCPTDPRCSVVSNGELRSSFQVGLPTLNNEGEAVSIPNTGYVELIRSSNGSVWRTYKQPSVQAAVVPDFCSGQAKSDFGWGNAVASSQQDQLANASSAESISIADEAINGGRTYFRKDFPINTTDTYTITARTSSPQDSVVIYVDGTLRLTAGGTIATANVSLNPGCHTITARLSNESILAKPSTFTMALQKSGGAPIVATDTSWRVSAGSPVHFSEKDYYRSSQAWQTVQDRGAASTFNANWNTATGDSSARAVTAPASTGCPSSCPANNYMYYRDDADVVLASAARVRLSAICDDSCVVYLDGKAILNSTGVSTVDQQTFTLTAGTHNLAVRVSNGAVGASYAAVSLYNLNSSSVLTRTDSGWFASSVTASNATPVDVYSYEDSFRPSPNDIP